MTRAVGTLGKGRWAHRLIPAIKEWLERRHGEINYKLTQFLMAHRGYRQYMHRFKLEISPDCPNNDGVPEDLEHVFFHCPRFVEERRKLEDTLGEVLVLENLMPKMLTHQANWDAVNFMIASIQTKLRKAEERRKPRSRAPRIEKR